MSSVRSVRRLAAVALCLPLLAAAACSGDDSTEPDGAPSSSSNASQAPTLRAEAKATSLDGAEAFARHWVEALNHASTSGDTTYLRTLGMGCKACSAMADGIDELYVAGGRLESSGWRVLKAHATPANAERTVVVRLRVLRPAEATYASKDAEPEFFEGGRQSYALQLVRGDGAWRVAKVFRVKA